jgi:teichuronic acid biosynthesis glycosyltransferase TuaG
VSGAAVVTPEVSIVVPAFNAARHLKATVESILAQSAAGFEVIIVDDCSTDDTARVAEACAARDSRVRLERMPANSGGPAGPRNFGIDRASAAWVAFCDADDLWHPDKLRLQLELASSSGADLVCTAIEDFPDRAGPPAWLGRALQRRPRSHPLHYWQMLLKDRIATSSVLCRRQALLAGRFDTARELVAVEDYHRWLQLMETPGFRVLRIEQPLVAYRRLPGSLSARKWLHVRKVMRVVHMAFERGGWRWAFPLAAPLLFASYGCQSVYWRVWRNRL